MEAEAEWEIEGGGGIRSERVNYGEVGLQCSKNFISIPASLIRGRERMNRFELSRNNPHLRNIPAM